MSEIYPNLTEELISDFEFVFSSTVFDMQRHRLQELESLIDEINSCDSDRITLRMQDEIPPFDTDGFENLIEFIKLSEKDIRITVGSTTRFPFSLHPLVCFFNFYQIQMPNLAMPYEEDSEQVMRFPIEKYHMNKKIDFSIKKNRGILSNRKVGRYREIVDSKIGSNFNGTYRYLEYDLFNNYTKEDNNKFPTWNNLLNEYESSLVSFIMETENLIHNYNPKYILNAITEKTPLAFMNFCIPIIFGGKYFLKELKELGFWVANNDFEFGGGDTEDDDIRILKFIECINKFNSMSTKQIKAYYLDNINKIQSNYDLASSIINNQTIQNKFPPYSNLNKNNIINGIL